MPLDRFVLIIVAVIAAAGLTVYVGMTLSAAATIPPLLLAVVPLLGVAAYILVRVIRERMINKEDDYYDSIER